MLPTEARFSREELAEELPWYAIGVLEEGVVEDQAELARRLGVRRARVTQAIKQISTSDARGSSASPTSWTPRSS